MNIRCVARLLGVGLFLAACTDETDDESSDDTESVDYTYDRIFRSDSVNRMDIVIAPEDFETMTEDLEALFANTGGPGGGGQGGIFEEDPVWVPVSLNFEDETFEHVGMRYKGNSTLQGLAQEGNRKKPFRLNMDKFDEEYPQTDKQRLDGFDKFSFSPNYRDDSQLREAFMDDLLDAQGVPVARFGFMEVYIDVGNGPEYWGLYTILEDPSDDPFMERVFGSDNGNMYKPDGEGADWKSFVESGFEKKTNEEEADWSDVIAAIDALHASRSDAASWRSGLEEHFDVDGFLRWLAINTVVVNWDCYGQMTHNYYLHGDIDSGLIRWIPWDHNEATLARGLGEPGAEQDWPEPVTDIFHTDVTDNWPLIRYLMDDEVYRDKYIEEVQSVVDAGFDENTVQSKLEAMHEVIAPSIGAEEQGSTTVSSHEAFESSLDVFMDHIQKRHQVVEQALNEG